MPSASRKVLTGVGLVVLAAAVLSFPSLAPNPYILSAGIVVLNYAVLSTSWNFVGGFTGYISLGHAAYFGVGAYATALLITKADVPPFLACFLGALDDAGLPADPEFREAMRAYMRWALDDVLAHSAEGSVVPPGAAMPRWGWDGLES